MNYVMIRVSLGLGDILTVKRIVFLVSFFVLITQLHASGVSHISYRIAGDASTTSYTNIPTISKGGYAVVLGTNIPWKNDLSFDVLSGYSVDFLDQSGSGKSLVQFPLEALIKYDAKVIHIGTGFSASLAGLGTKLEFLSDAQFISGSLSYILVAEFPLVKDFHRYFGLKTMFIFLNTSGEGQSIQETQFYMGFAF